MNSRALVGHHAHEESQHIYMYTCSTEYLHLRSAQYAWGGNDGGGEVDHAE